MAVDNLSGARPTIYTVIPNNLHHKTTYFCMVYLVYCIVVTTPVFLTHHLYSFLPENVSFQAL